MSMSPFITFLLALGAAGVVGGPYILYLAFFKPNIFLKPKLAKWQGLAAFIVGVLILLWYFIFKPLK